MNAFQYAIARCFAQLQAVSYARNLTPEEVKLMNLLQPHVENYEGQETRKI